VLRLRIQRLVSSRGKVFGVRRSWSRGANVRRGAEFASGFGAYASQQLQAALALATPVYTLYILVGLRQCDRAAFEKVFDSLARPNDDVEVVRGCMISKEPFRQILSQIQDGRFDDYLTRKPR
jgi:hypothetical protein